VKQDYLNGLYQNETVDWADELLGDPAKRMNDDERRRFSDVVDLVARFKNIHGAQWLDFGCQTGELGLDAISRHGVAMSGVEISPDYAERAARLWQRGPHAVRPSLEDFQRRQFDVISSLETLEHMAEPWKMVASLRKHLRPGGVLTVSVPSSHYFRLKYHVFRLVRLLVDRQAIRERPQSMRPSLYGLCHTHLYNFTPKSLSLLLEQQGLKVRYIGGIGWLSRYRILEKIASAIEMLTRRRVAIYPSVIAVAYNPPD
jgi:2-polyprenyl-3-methyl-5-hydroxy-6-metoxy-1,4-benzoquinol methylase